jgi:hypothetical protein
LAATVWLQLRDNPRSTLARLRRTPEATMSLSLPWAFSLGDMAADVFQYISGKISPEIPQLQLILELCFSRQLCRRFSGGNAMFKVSVER